MQVDRALERYHQYFLAMAKALYANRLHLLRLTEVVRHRIKPNDEGVLLLPPDLDEQMKQQAFDFVMTMFPEEFHVDLLQMRKSWITVH
jgi:hypothetical protein